MSVFPRLSVTPKRHRANPTSNIGMDFQLKRHRTDKVSRDAALRAMERAAEVFGYVEFGKRDFARAGVGLSASTVRNAFDGSWSAALAALRERLREQGKELRSRTRAIWSDEEMFAEMGRIWTQKGHRPSKDEWNAASPNISYNAYRQRFRGWQNACLRFIEHQMHGSPPRDAATLSAAAVANAERKPLNQPIASSSRREEADRRDPSQALINKVWKRDNFRCRRCGKSPATHFGVVLEVDHRVPWVRAGKTTFDNLQTLCSSCNRSKRDEVPLSGVGV